MTIRSTFQIQFLMIMYAFASVVIISFRTSDSIGYLSNLLIFSSIIPSLLVTGRMIEYKNFLKAKNDNEYLFVLEKLEEVEKLLWRLEVIGWMFWLGMVTGTALSAFPEYIDNKSAVNLTVYSIIFERFNDKLREFWKKKQANWEKEKTSLKGELNSQQIQVPELVNEQQVAVVVVANEEIVTEQEYPSLLYSHTI